MRDKEIKKLASIFKTAAARLTIQALDAANLPGSAIGAFGGKRNFQKVLAGIDRIETANSPLLERGADREQELFCVVPDTLGSHAARHMTRLVEKWDAGTRPALPAVAAAWLARLRLASVPGQPDDGQTGRIAAVILLAARAEMVRGKPAHDAGVAPGEPLYHNRLHFLHVLQATCHLIEADDDLGQHNVKDAANLNAREKTLLILAALAHDLDHPGRSNGRDPQTGLPALYVNEDASFAIADRIFVACGLTEEDRKSIKIMLRATDPNGPHKFMKDLMRAHRDSVNPVFDAITPAGQEKRFADLRPLAEDKKLCAMAAMLSDADLHVSAGAGTDCWRRNCEKLSAELAATGIAVDFTAPEARTAFFRNVVGENGFASAAGCAAFNEAYFEMIRELKADEYKVPIALPERRDPL